MSAPARKDEPPPRRPHGLATDAITPEQRAAREEIMELILQHNPEPTEEELDAVRQEWVFEE